MSAPHKKTPAAPLPSAIPNRPFPLKSIVGALLAVAFAVSAAALLLPRTADAADAANTTGTADTPRHLTLTAAQRAAVQNAQRTLNAITTLRARFIQITSQGNMSTGEFTMARPGRMRIAYDPPVPVLIVSNGTTVMYKDKELDQLSYLPLSSLPAALFIGERVDFLADTVLLTDVTQSKGTLRLTLKQARDPMEGTLTLVFATRPMVLKQWAVRDSQGITTTVTLQDQSVNVALNDALFKVESRILPNTRNQ